MILCTDSEAPEILRYERYDDRADLWSLGAVMFEMLTGSPPFLAQNHIQLLKVIERQDLVIPGSVGETAASLLRGLLRVDPRERISLEQVLEHSFLTTADDLLFEVRPIPIAKRKSSLSASLSSSPSQASLVSNAILSRRRSSIPTTPLQPTSMSSSREQWNWEDEAVIMGLPGEARIMAKKAQILYDLHNEQQAGLQHSFTLYLSAHDRVEEGEAKAWLMSRLKDIAVQIDFTASIDNLDHSTLTSLYDMAMRSAVEGGFQELLGRFKMAMVHYERSMFIITQFGLAGAVVEEYKRDIARRLEGVISKL